LHKKTDEAVISILVSGIIGKHIEKLYDLNVLLIYNKINPQEQEQVAKRSKELIKMMKVLNKAKAKEIYKENKDMFSRTDRKEIEDALGIESSAWGIQGIINAVDKGITRMVSTPAPAAVISQQIAEQTPVQNQPAPQTQPVQPVIPMGSSIPTRNVHIKKRTPMMNRPVMPADIIQPKVEPIAHPEVTAIPMPSVSSSVNKPSSAIPMPTIPESMKSKPAATIFMPTIPESIKSKSSTDIPMPSVTPVNKPSNTIPMPVIPESMKSKPAATIPMPVIPESMKVKPEVSSPVDNKLESAVIPAVPGNTTAAPVQPAPIDAADDNIDYKKLYSDKERYQMIESEPERGSWLGYIPGVNAFTGMVKKLARKSDIPVVELSQDTTFIFDKKMKKWITVDSKTLKPIKMEVTQRRPEDKEPILGAAAPKPIAMPVITGKMPKRGADGKVDFGPVGTSLEARYGKPMIQSSIDTTMTDAAPGFPMPQGLYTRKNAKVFIPQAPQPEDECTK
ncbi:hypothetical protein NEMIN01_1975, partial [Nematocida minor]|uniref:uncharacterized protein n=1 Tax=Nematocida minor TaxID=1912983 RepID=UPI0022200436